MARLSEATQIYANYDKSMVDWFRALKYHSRPILCVFATPERAFAQVEKQIRERRGSPPKVLPLAWLSIQRTTSVFDHERYNNGTLRRMYYTPDRSKYYGTLKPQPVNLQYDVNFWTRNLEDLDSLTAQMLVRMRPHEFWITVDHPFPIRQRNVLVTLGDPRDFSQLEPNEKQRVLRRSFPLTVYGWICFPVEEVGIVEEVTTEVYESDDMETLGDLLDTIVVP